MLTEPLFFVVLLLVLLPVGLYFVSREQQKELHRFEAKLRDVTTGMLHKMELAVGAQNQKLADHAEFKLDSTADRLNQTLEVLRSAIEHQARQQERIAERLSNLESMFAAAR
ncbi:MAG: hypothetical protein HKN13_12490 [Rhodothermales bacterium]|nr:hypothetical protein [Rhodothermales bacterium]